jgi:transcription initiation factor TFIID subunit 7
MIFETKKNFNLLNGMTDAAPPKALKIRIGGVLEAQPFPYNYEEQFIVRFPSSVAAQLREELREAEQPEDLSIIFTDARRANVHFHGRRWVGVLLDLPTIIESHKTFDRSQYYKTADICQMLLVLPEGTETMAKLEAWEVAGWQFSDGITPPLRNVRARRFKKTASYGQQKDVEAIERRVQALLDRDAAAASSTFTVYDALGRAVLRGGGMDGKFVRVKPGEAGILEEVEEADAEMEESVERHDSSDEDFAAELEEEMLAIEEEVEGTEMEGELKEEESPIMMIPARQTSTAPTPSPSPAVMELQAKINERKAQLASVTNPLIKARLEDVIRQLEQDLQARMG